MGKEKNEKNKNKIRILHHYNQQNTNILTFFSFFNLIRNKIILVIDIGQHDVVLIITNHLNK
jgi:hypothetical protein